ncbi:MAG: quinoprotein dehydrogenase-associated putative ABC transporter substrate-binding protein, partial [Pseudolabrys sp.]
MRRSAASSLAVAALCLIAAGAAVRAQGVPSPPGAAPAPAQGQAPFELVDPNVFRVCSDPRNMPYSNTEGEGFENKLAEVFAKALGKSVAYTWYPGA